MKKNYKAITAFVALLSMVTLKMEALNGVVTINSSNPASATNFTSFTSFASSLNTNGITGTLVVNVGGNTPYQEQVSFGQITGASATNTITINGNGHLLTYTATSSGPYYTLELNGTDYMYINNLNISSVDQNDGWACLLTNKANYNTFTSCSFSVDVNAGNYNLAAFVLSTDETYYSSGESGSYNTVLTSTISGGNYCVFAEGNTSGGTSMNNTFKKCHITDWYGQGISGYGSKNLKIEGCLFDRLTSTGANYSFGVLSGYGAQGLIFTNNIIEKLSDANQSSSVTLYMFSSIGNYNQSPSNRCKIVNNIIRDIVTGGDMYIFDYCTGGVDVLQNTISLDDAAYTGSTDTYIFNSCYSSNGQVLNVKNNIFTLTKGGSGSKVGYYDNSSSFSGNIFDYNDWYISGLGSNYYYAQLNNSNSNSFASVQSSYSVETHGLNADPLYVSLATGDLHPTNSTINNAGTAVNVSVDNLYAPRNQANPDPGALEFLSNNCVTTPTNISVVTPTYAICPGKTVDIGLNGYTSDLSVTYQWLTSTTSSVGPWTTITGANSVNYTTPNVNATTYYGVAVSCTLVGTTVTVANVINIAGTSSSVVPVFESFENVMFPNDLPNCSWFAPDQGNTALTYTANTSQNRSASSGSKFAVFATGNNASGTNAFYTNGIQLLAGITYSASTMWKTDFDGYDNITDFSILYGTSQSQTGLTTIVTTGGVAASGPYTALTNTFQVPTSGIYYVAIQVTTNGNYGSDYLTWDDFSITIPCSLNTTSVTVSTSTNVICAGETVALSASGADEYTWSTGSSSASITDTPFQNMQYYVVATNTLSGCSQTVNAQYVNVRPSPNVIVIGSKPTICVGDNITLSANSNVPTLFQWNNNSTNAVITVTPAQNTTYTVTGTNGIGCSTKVEYSVVVLPNPVIGVSSNPSSNQICKGEYANLTGTGGVSYAWASNYGYIQSNVATVNPMVSTVYTVSGTGSNGCVGKFTYVLGVDECTGLTKLNAVSGIKLYPNPASTSFVVESTSTSEKTIEVIDLTGRVILTNTNSDLNTNINISNFANGVYYVKIKTETANEVIKIVKQ